jgi:hypothetical protein
MLQSVSGTALQGHNCRVHSQAKPIPIVTFVGAGDVTDISRSHPWKLYICEEVVSLYQFKNISRVSLLKAKPLTHIQRGPKKCTHSLSAAITPDTLTAVFARQFGGIDAV